jgi:hypothetical protein
MRPADWRKFLLVVGCGWILLTAAGIYYAGLKHIPFALAAPLIAAFLVEYAFYLVPGFPRLREWLADRIPPRRLALFLAISALAPYLIYSVPSGQFRVIAASRLAALVLALSFWYIVRGPSRTGDLALLGLVGVVLVSKFFKQIYISPVPSIDFMGKLMLIRLYASVMLMQREVEGTGYGFLPSAKDWRIGLRYFLYFLPVGVALSLVLGLVRFKTSPSLLAMAPLQFLGALWLTALWEEFLTRGLLQQWISDWTGRPQFGLLFASAVYGLSHLWFRGFPNWKWVIITTVLGWFCGKAYNEAGGIRAAMVTHALVVAILQTLRS